MSSTSEIPQSRDCTISKKKRSSLRTQFWMLKSNEELFTRVDSIFTVLPNDFLFPMHYPEGVSMKHHRYTTLFVCSMNLFHTRCTVRTIGSVGWKIYFTLIRTQLETILMCMRLHIVKHRESLTPWCDCSEVILYSYSMTTRCTCQCLLIEWLY